MLKIIIKNKETGKQQCVDISKEKEKDIDIRNLRVGMVVYYQGKLGLRPNVVEIVKIVDDRPLDKTLPGYWTPYPWQKGLAFLQAHHFNYPRGAGKATFTKESVDDLIKRNEAKRDREEYRDKPYFSVRLDPIKGQSDGEENLEKMKFPCWVTYKYSSDGKDKIGQLVTGNPNYILEYQLIDMMEQVPVDECCTVFRDTDLKRLMEQWSIEVIKGESQLWKIGKFNI